MAPLIEDYKILRLISPCSIYGTHDHRQRGELALMSYTFSSGVARRSRAESDGLLPHTGNYRSGGQGGSGYWYVADASGSSYYASMDLHQSPQQSSDPGHLWNYRDTGKLWSNAERSHRNYPNAPFDNSTDRTRQNGTPYIRNIVRICDRPQSLHKYLMGGCKRWDRETFGAQCASALSHENKN